MQGTVRVVLVCQNLTKRFGRTTALDQVTMALHAGELVAVVGANGAGKTTLLECLSTVQLPSDGAVLVDRQPLSRDRIDLRRQLLYLPEAPESAFGTILNHITAVASAFGADSDSAIAERVYDLLQSFDIHTLVDRPVQSLSRGQKYKGMLVSLLAVDPSIWLLDEPFASGMDPNGLSAFRQYALEAVRERKRTVLYSTQILDVAQRFADRICILHEGRIVEFDTPESLLRSAGDSDLSAAYRHLLEPES